MKTVHTQRCHSFIEADCYIFEIATRDVPIFFPLARLIMSVHDPPGSLMIDIGQNRIQELISPLGQILQPCKILTTTRIRTTHQSDPRTSEGKPYNGHLRRWSTIEDDFETFRRNVLPAIASEAAPHLIDSCRQYPSDHLEHIADVARQGLVCSSEAIVSGQFQSSACEPVIGAIKQIRMVALVSPLATVVIADWRGMRLGEQDRPHISASELSTKNLCRDFAVRKENQSKDFCAGEIKVPWTFKPIQNMVNEFESDASRGHFSLTNEFRRTLGKPLERCWIS